MGISYETLAASRKYTDDSLKGVGALAGKPCQIQSITPITGGNRVTFLWIDDNSDSHTSTMDVMNGAQGDPGDPGAPGDPGQDGVGIKSLAINSSNHLIVTLTDDNTVDAGEIPAVQSDWDQSDSSASDFIKNKPTLGTAASKDSTDAVTEDSTDLVESGAVFTGLTAKANKTDVATDIQKVYNVMGQNGAKNYLQILASGTFVGNGITFVVNDDGTVTVSTDENGATGDTNFYLNPATQVWVDPDYPIGDYILSGCPAGGSAETYRLALSRQGASSVFDTGTGTTFTHANGVKVLALIQIGTGTVLTTPIVFKPMIRLAADTDTTYQPYAPTNAKLNEEKMSYADNGILGAKNLLYHGGTQTTQGVEFAGNPGDVLTVTRTSSSNSHAYYNNGKFTLKPGTYIFSNGYNSLPSGIQATYLYNHTDSAYFINCNNGPKVFTLTEEKILAFNIEVQKTQSPSGVKIYPMIRRATDTDTAFQPYAKTNKELTEAVDGMMMKVGRYTKTVKGTNTTYGALIDQICADMKTMIDGFADTNTKVIPMSITIDGLVTVFVRPDQYKKGDNFNIVAYCTSCDGTTFNTFYLRGLSGSGNSTIYRQDVTASSQAINDFTSTSFTGDKNISLIYDRYQII